MNPGRAGCHDPGKEKLPGNFPVFPLLGWKLPHPTFSGSGGHPIFYILWCNYLRYTS